MTKISELINKNHQKKVRIAVFGDCLLDEYYKVKIRRISPEAPVPVMLSKSDQPDYVLPGGAANIAAQLKSWNVDCTLFGLMSPEDAAVYERCGISLPKYIGLEDPIKHRVPRKKRFVDGQNIIRWDIESPNYGEEIDKNIDMLRLCFEYHLTHGGFDAVIFADYDKGVFKDFKKTQDLIILCNTHGIPTIVDPKDEPIEKWIGCTYFKLNNIEAERFTGSHEPKAQVEKLSNRLRGLLGTSNIVVTHGGLGVTIFNAEDGKINNYNGNKEVVAKNFSGAGDAFCAFFALGISHDFSILESTEIAFNAGRIYVQREYNKPLIPLDLYDTKFVDPRDLKNRNFKLACSNGAYDLMHHGHISTFEFAKSKADKLAILINSDDSIKQLKGVGRPIIPLEQRMKMVASLECVDYVISFDETSPDNLLEKIAPDVLCKGEDWKEKGVRGAKFAKELVFAPFIEDISTTNIIKKIINYS